MNKSLQPCWEKLVLSPQVFQKNKCKKMDEIINSSEKLGFPVE